MQSAPSTEVKSVETQPILFHDKIVTKINAMSYAEVLDLFSSQTGKFIELSKDKIVNFLKLDDAEAKEICKTVLKDKEVILVSLHRSISDLIGAYAKAKLLVAYKAKELSINEEKHPFFNPYRPNEKESQSQEMSAKQELSSSKHTPLQDIKNPSSDQINPILKLFIKCIDDWKKQIFSPIEEPLISTLQQAIDKKDFSQQMIEHIHQLVKDQLANKKSYFNVHQSSDPLHVVISSLLKANIFPLSPSSGLHYSTLNNILTGKTELTDGDEKIIDISKLKIPVKNLSLSYTDMALYYLTTFKYVPRSLEKNGLEKLLETIKDEHGKDNFELTLDHLDRIRLRLREHWEKYSEFNRNSKEYEKPNLNSLAKYLTQIDRSNLVYMATAEILAQVYRHIEKNNPNIDIKDEWIYVHHLLAPGCFHPHTYLPTEAIFNLTPYTPHVIDIPLQNLVITSTGYAVNIEWVPQLAQEDGNYLNPYTGKSFTDAEFMNLHAHPKFEEMKNRKSFQPYIKL